MTSSNSKPGIAVWDIWIRLFHWLLVVSVGFSLLSGETGFLFFDWHKNVGEWVLVLLLFRLIWGFIGSSNTGLVGLIVNPMKAFSHLAQLLRGTAAQTRGHNAAGGWAVLVMLLAISFQAISGLFIADEDELIEGHFYGELSSGVSEQLLYLHHLNAQFILILVAVHVVMIFFYLIRSGHNLIKPMVTGKMDWRADQKPPTVKFTNSLVGLILICICFGVIGFIVGWF